MERNIDKNAAYLRVHKPVPNYAGMGAYAQLQQQQFEMSTTYPKINYSLPMQHKRRTQQQQQHAIAYNSNQQFQQQKSNCSTQDTFKSLSESQFKEQSNNYLSGNFEGTYTITAVNPTYNDTISKSVSQQTNGNGNNNKTGIGNNNNNNTRRFVNVGNLIMQSNKSSQTNGVTTTVFETNETADSALRTKQATPTSSYSQKSTASAKSTNSGRSNAHEHVHNVEFDNLTNTPREREETLQIEDISDDPFGTPVYAPENYKTMPAPLRRNESVASIQSKAESIKTLLEEQTPPQAISRTQSAKSLIIEEDIEGESFKVVEDVPETMQIEADVTNRSDVQQIPDIDDELERLHSPTIAELKLLSRHNSLIKSMECLYKRPPSKQDSLDTTETSSQSSSLQLNGTITNPKHKSNTTPLKKSKKNFLLNKRRISPVKQSIKQTQAELYPKTLQSFEKPREALIKTFSQMDSNNWELVVQGLNSMVRMMRHHQDFLENQIHMTCIQLTRAVRNLRSQVSRSACQAATELFSLKSKLLEPECDELVVALLHRTADTNRFLRADAEKALESMCDNLTPSKVLSILVTKAAQHQHATVRTTAAKLLNRLVERLGYDKVYTMPREQRDKFFITAANLLLEGSLETRSYAKSIFRQLSEHPNYNRLLVDIIPARTYRNVEKTLRNIH